MSFCKNCITGVKHEGTAKGTFETLGSIRTYVATPTVDYPKDKAVLFLTDVFGNEFINNQLLADAFAENGFKVYMPDLFNGDPVGPDQLSDPNFSLMTWYRPNHTADKTRTYVDSVIAELAARGVKSLYATSYCYGGRIMFDLAFENKIKVAVASHPSLLTIPDDLEKYAKLSTVPLLINSCPIDDQFPPAASAFADNILGDGIFAPGYKRIHWEGCQHGFAVRGDMNNPLVKAGKEGAFKETVEWFLKF